MNSRGGWIAQAAAAEPSPACGTSWGVRLYYLPSACDRYVVPPSTCLPSTMLRFVGAVAGLIITIGLIIVNTLGGLVAGIWLAVLGKWMAILLGLAMALAMPSLWMILTMPTMLLAGVEQNKIEQNQLRRHSILLVAAGSIYTTSLICGWVLLVFWLFSKRVGDHSPIPFLLWAYSTSMAPLAYMSTKSKDGNWAESVGFLAAIITSVVLCAMWLAGAAALSGVWATGVIAVIAGLTCTKIASEIDKERQADILRKEEEQVVAEEGLCSNGERHDYQSVNVVFSDCRLRMRFCRRCKKGYEETQDALRRAKESFRNNEENLK